MTAQLLEQPPIAGEVTQIFVGGGLELGTPASAGGCRSRGDPAGRTSSRSDDPHQLCRVIVLRDILRVPRETDLEAGTIDAAALGANVPAVLRSMITSREVEWGRLAVMTRLAGRGGRNAPKIPKSPP